MASGRAPEAKTASWGSCGRGVVVCLRRAAPDLVSGRNHGGIQCRKSRFAILRVAGEAKVAGPAQEEFFGAIAYGISTLSS